MHGSRRKIQREKERERERKRERISVPSALSDVSRVRPFAERSREPGRRGEERDLSSGPQGMEGETYLWSVYEKEINIEKT